MGSIEFGFLNIYFRPTSYFGFITIIFHYSFAFVLYFIFLVYYYLCLKAPYRRPSVCSSVQGRLLEARLSSVSRQGFHSPISSADRAPATVCLEEEGPSLESGSSSVGGRVF